MECCLLLLPMVYKIVCKNIREGTGTGTGLKWQQRQLCQTEMAQGSCPSAWDIFTNNSSLHSIETQSICPVAFSHAARASL